MKSHFETLLNSMRSLQVFSLRAWRSITAAWAPGRDTALPRLLAGFTAVVVATIVITVLIFRLGTVAIDSAFDDFIAMNEFDEDVDTAARLTTDLQVTGHLFRADRSNETLLGWQTHLTRVERGLSHLKGHELDDRPTTMIAEVEAGLRHYATTFRRFAKSVEYLGYTYDDGLQGAFRAEAHALESALTAMGDSRLLVELLTMRRHEKDFLLRKQPDHSAKFRAVGARLSARLRSGAVVPAAAAPAMRHLASYQRIFLQYVTESGQVDSRFAETERAIAKVLVGLAGLKGLAQSGIATSEATFAEGRDQISTTTLFGIILMLGAASLACGLMLRQMVNLVREAERLGRTKGEFLSMMGHELRTPLNAIIGFTDLIQKEMFGPLANARYMNYIRLTHTAGRQLLLLVNDVLELAAVDQDRKVANENVSVATLVEKSIRFLSQSRANQTLAVTAAIDDKLVVSADPAMLQRILIAIVGNAIKFTGQGGTVRVEAAPRGQDRVAITVTDTGIGIPLALLSKVTQPFFQVDRGNTRKFDGGGIGLSVVKRLIELNRGECKIESELNRGTVVTIILPAGVAADKVVPSTASRAMRAVG